MDPKKLADAAHPEAIGTFLAARPMTMHHGEGPATSVREAEHRGHHITIRTTYEIEVDGRKLDLPLGLDNDGHVHCHALPNYQFASAIDLVKRTIDTFPREFPGTRRRATPSPDKSHGHSGSMHMSMGRKKRG